MRETHKSYHRRERRKAKQSNWKREPKQNPKKVAHGPNGNFGHTASNKTAGGFTKPPAKAERLSRLNDLLNRLLQNSEE